MPPIAERPGQAIGHYTLLEEIGEGGFGVVYLAEQREPVERKVALKILKAGLDTRQVVARFEAERQALALMDHPNIARVLDGGTTASGRPYFVMELVKGVPITQYCDEHRLTPRERLALFVQVCHAVQHAHQKGIIHRDLKPSNVMVTLCDGVPVPKIIDFGVAKATGGQLTEKTVFTGHGQMVGTLEYMSPEQARLDQLDIDTRSDIYSLGVVLYELLSGQTPFDRQRLRSAAFDEMLRMIREEEPPKPSTRLSESKEALASISAQRHTEPARLTKLVRGELDWIVMKALEKDRSRRYETANGFALDIERYLADEPVLACPPSVTYRFRKFARRNRAGLAVAGLVLFFLVLLGGGVGWVLRDREARREEAAQQARESLSRARRWVGENKVALARQELAAAKARMGSDRAALAGLVEEIAALEAELARYERFLDLVEQAHEAEIPHPMVLILQGDSLHGTVVARPQMSSPVREPAKAVPFLIQALSCYGVLEQNDWSARLERGLLEPDQVSRVRRMAYEELLWLADDVAGREVDHRSGRKMSPQEAAQEGLVFLRQAETGAPPTSAFYLIRARLLKALGRQAEVRQDEELAQKTPATIALDHYLLARAAYDARDKVEAVKQYEAALRVEPTHYWSLLGLGDSLSDLGQQEQDFALAAAAYTGCILKRPDHARPYSGRGQAYSKLHRSKEAEAEYRKALRLRPDDPEAHNNLGSALHELGMYPGAEAEYREALRLRADYPEAHVNLGHALSWQRSLASAEAEYREALRLRPDFPAARVSLAAALTAQGKRSTAEAVCRETLRLWPDCIEAYIGLCYALEYQQGKEVEMESVCREALRRRPDLLDARAGLSRGLLAQGKYTEAEAESRHVLRLRPNDPAAHADLGLALLRQGKYAEAEAEYRESLRLSADQPSAPVVHTCLASTLSPQGKYAEAEAQCREALRLGPGYPTAQAALGNALLGQGNAAAAARFYAQAFAVWPWLADHQLMRYCYNAACAAALAGCGQGRDAAELDEAERAGLRGQALICLRSDLAAWSRLLETQPAEARASVQRTLKLDVAMIDLRVACPHVQETLRRWQQDASFAGVRGNALANLPEAERQAWQQLWANVEALRLRAEDPEACAKLGSVLAEAKDPERALTILTDLIASVPEHPRLDELLWRRGEVALRLARWKDAETDFMKVIERSFYKHHRHYKRFSAAPVCLLAGDEEGYRRVCRAMLAEPRWPPDQQSAQTKGINEGFAETTARACLILPVADADLTSAVRMAKEATNAQPERSWGLLAQGMADCRTGSYAAAVERLNQAIERNASGRVDALDAMAHLFLAMAHQGQGHKEEAKKHLDAGRQLVLEEARGLRKRGFRGPWWEWTTAFVVYPQAESRVEGTPETRARSRLDAEIEAGSK
jgi:serine/threonine protein kinase/tetratricopeptide (TPR) repeat protein